VFACHFSRSSASVALSGLWRLVQGGLGGFSWVSNQSLQQLYNLRGCYLTIVLPPTKVQRLVAGNTITPSPHLQLLLFVLCMQLSHQDRATCGQFFLSCSLLLCLADSRAGLTATSMTLRKDRAQVIS
jgi:hypothetical protein